MMEATLIVMPFLVGEKDNEPGGIRK